MSKETLSVLMSVYAEEVPQHFDVAMESIWDAQTRQPDEIVLVVDGPVNDELSKHVLHWKHHIGEPMKILWLEEHQGTGRAKQQGYYRCNGDFIAIMDTDDQSVPERFQLQLDCFKNNPELMVVGGQVTEFMSNDEGTYTMLQRKQTPLLGRDIVAFSRQRNPFTHVTLMMRHEAMELIGGYKHHWFMEDYNLCLRFLSKLGPDKVLNMPNVLVNVRIDNGMFQRRTGWTYIKSEWQLAWLKIELSWQSLPMVWLYFFARSIPRLLPSSLLRRVYRLLRYR